MIRKMGGMRKSNRIPLLKNGNYVCKSNKDKAEAFVKIHSNNNISEDMKEIRQHLIRDNSRLLAKKGTSGSSMALLYMNLYRL